MLGWGQWLPDNKHIVGPGGVGRSDVLVMNVDTQEVQRLTDDGRSRFVFWHDPALGL